VPASTSSLGEFLERRRELAAGTEPVSGGEVQNLGAIAGLGYDDGGPCRPA
jgi:hypothetical protein